MEEPGRIRSDNFIELRPPRPRPNRPPKELPLKRRRIFALITVLVPFAALALLELGLRVGHYGPDLSLFVTEELGGRTYHIMNPEVKNRYFLHVDFSPTTSFDFFQVPKPAGTYRIFCLGGSTTIGYPYGYIGSFSTFLRQRLRTVFPDRLIEVINVGMTATNSFTTLDIARELLDQQPDLFIVYDGHNEFYGALGIASHESTGQIRWLTEAYLRLIHVRTFLLLRDLYGRLGGIMRATDDHQLEGTMMERLARGQFVPWGNATYRSALSIFTENLKDIARAASSRGIPVILATQVSNLRDRAPFVSANSPAMTPQERLTMSTAYNRGLTARMEGDPASALTAFREAEGIDSARADTHYEIARCLDTLGRKDEAEREYIRARDLDQLRFRTSSDFNRAIMQMTDDSRVVSVDMEQVFRSASPASLIGNALILEHLHPNGRGQFLMAKAIAGAMREHEFLASAQEWSARDTVSDVRLWKARSLTVLDEMCAARRTQILTSGWPFVPSDAGAPAPGRDPLSSIVEQIVHGRISWERGHVAAAEYFRSTGDSEKVEAEYRALIDQIPLNISPYIMLSDLSIREGKREQARTMLLQSLQIEQTFHAYKALGSLELDMARPDSAMRYFARAAVLSANPREQSEASYLSAVALVRSGDLQRAIPELRRAVQLNPSLTLASDLLEQLTGVRQ